MIIVPDQNVATFVRKVTGVDAVIADTPAAAAATPDDLRIVVGPPPGWEAGDAPRLAVGDLGMADCVRLAWWHDLGRRMSDDELRVRSRVAQIRVEEIADHERARRGSVVAKAWEHLRRRAGREHDRARDVPTGAGMPSLDLTVADTDLSDHPSVSVIVPTRDRPELLRQVLDGLDRTEWPGLETVIVDNGSRDPEARSILAATSARVIELDIPFNFPRLVNCGVGATRSEVVILLNNDIELADPNWVGPMVDALRDREVGVVGRLLTYPDGTIQHVGMAVANGVPVHPFVGRQPDDPSIACAVREGDRMSVTAACMAVRRATYRRLGAFDPLLAHDYNDIDFCLRAGDAGYRVRMVADPPLVHHESKSRGTDVNPQTVGDWMVMRARWADVLSSPDSYGYLV